MVPDITHLIAAICPDVYCRTKTRALVKSLSRNGLAAGNRLVLPPIHPDTEEDRRRYEEAATRRAHSLANKNKPRE